MDEDPISDDAGRAYRTMMHEIKLRVDALDLALDGGHMGPFLAVFVEEFCYLQLRMICELIAFGCLIVHGNLKPKAALYKTHKADWIMGELEKLHSDFFPTAVEIKRTPKGEVWNDITDGVLTMAELKTLWSRECGNRLHRGSTKSVIGNVLSFEIPKVKAWLGKITKLLEQHYVVTPDLKFMFQVVMDDGTGKVASRTIRLKFLEERHSGKLASWIAKSRKPSSDDSR